LAPVAVTILPPAFSDWPVPKVMLNKSFEVYRAVVGAVAVCT
jgi:hypothetical protein